MKEINKNRPFFEDESEELNKEGITGSTEDSEDDINDTLEVVIEEEQDEKQEENTRDDIFDDDELDLDPTLDSDDW